MTPKSASLIAPSILSADFSRLAEEVRAVEQAGADWIHVDVMDGHFVPNLTIGPLIVKALRPHTRLPLDCHLMVSRPEDWVEEFARAGADRITVHAEASVHLDRLVHQIRDAGCKAGVSINPATPLSAIEEVLGIVDQVLVMSVNPGFGGQKFIEGAISKVERLVEMRRSLPAGDSPKSQSFLIEIDGGIHEENIGRVVRAGVDVLVAGSAVFTGGDPAGNLKKLRAAIAKSAS